MISNWRSFTTPSKSKAHPTVQRRARKGIPDALRGKVWNLMGDVEGLMERNEGKYGVLVEKSRT